jgi:hypothetical protein
VRDLLGPCEELFAIIPVLPFLGLGILSHRHKTAIDMELPQERCRFEFRAIDHRGKAEAGKADEGVIRDCGDEMLCSPTAVILQHLDF